MFDDFIWPKADTACQQAALSEYQTVDAAIKYCAQKRVVIQAGGNCGVWPKYLSTIFRHVYTFEPEPENFRCMMQNARASNVSMVEAALGEKLGQTGMKGTPQNAGGWQTGIDGDIAVLAIDDLLLMVCDLIALDVEGDELAALKGAAETIKRAKPVIMFEDRGYKVPMGEAEKWLQQFGYRVAVRTKRDVICLPS